MLDQRKFIPSKHTPYTIVQSVCLVHWLVSVGGLRCMVVFTAVIVTPQLGHPSINNYSQPITVRSIKSVSVCFQTCRFYWLPLKCVEFVIRVRPISTVTLYALDIIPFQTKVEH